MGESSDFRCDRLTEAEVIWICICQSSLQSPLLFSYFRLMVINSATFRGISSSLSVVMTIVVVLLLDRPILHLLAVEASTGVMRGEILSVERRYDLVQGAEAGSGAVGDHQSLQGTGRILWVSDLMSDQRDDLPMMSTCREETLAVT